jgi:CubicO group peptidase (beta-lactamase class C family)
MPFDELLKQKISDPLGMDRTYSTTSNEAIFNETVDAYRFDEEAQGWIKNSFIDLTIGRRVFSTSENLYRWAKAMNDTTFLSEESLNQMTINHLNELEEEVSYGYGWVVYNEGDDFSMGNLNIDKPYIIHGGSTEGYKSILINIEDGEWILSILANSGNRTNELELAQGIIEIIKSYNSL